VADRELKIVIVVVTKIAHCVGEMGSIDALYAKGLEQIIPPNKHIISK
jgi:hypothetical protein